MGPVNLVMTTVRAAMTIVLVTLQAGLRATKERKRAAMVRAVALVRVRPECSLRAKDRRQKRALREHPNPSPKKWVDF